jgi:Aegerolysin
MAYAQWVSITIISRGARIGIKNATLAYGKFHQSGNKDAEISIDEINKIQINTGESSVINSCGREDSPSGTEGRFDIFDLDKNVKIGEYYWDCPWGSKTNTSIWTPSLSEDYVTQVTGGNLDSGALGNVTIKCVKIS